MTTTAKAVSPGAIEIEISIRMTLGEWQLVANTLRRDSKSYPERELWNAIEAAITSMKKQFELETPKE